MKTVILAGGLGTRLSEETVLRPKPMVEIGGRPILWHIMQIYAAAGIDDFVIACGYKGEVIREYFHLFAVRNSDYRLRLRDGALEWLDDRAPDWHVCVMDTGAHTMTGGRLRRLKNVVGG